MKNVVKNNDSRHNGGRMYYLLSDLIVLVHFLFIAFVVAGGLLVVRWPRLAFIHLPAAVWGALIEFTGWICPLTPLENNLRRLGGGSPYGGDFIGQYIIPVIYPANLTPVNQYILGAIVIIFNLVFYILVIRKLRLRRLTSSRLIAG